MKRTFGLSGAVCLLGACGIICAGLGFAQDPPLTPGVILTSPMDGAPQVHGNDAASGTETISFLASPSAVPAGVRIAVGDVNGDGIADIVTGAGVGVAGGQVRVFDGRDLALLASFFAFDVAFSGGVYVSAGDVNGDGAAEIIVGAGAGGGPQVKVFDGKTLEVIGSFFAYDPAFTGGVNVAAGDFNFDGVDDIATGADSASGPHVKVFDGTNFSLQRSFFAFDAAQAGGVHVGAGDVDGDGYADLLAGSGEGVASHVKVFSGKDLSVLADVVPFAAAFMGGVRVATGDVNASGGAPELLVAQGPGGGLVSFFDSATGAPFSGTIGSGFSPFGAAYTGGVFVAAPKPPPATPTPTPEPTATPRDGRLFGDFDDSGCTDIGDFLILLDYWQLPYGGGAEIVIGDFLVLLDYWNTGATCP